jgi:hypothetical protein
MIILPMGNLPIYPILKSIQAVKMPSKLPIYPILGKQQTFKLPIGALEYKVLGNAIDMTA